MKRNELYYLIWTVIFGVALAIGGSALEVFRIPFLNATLATFWVAILITLNKIVIARPLSVTHMYIVASLISIFTAYLGPPSPLKPILIFAGFSFDLATRFRTTDIHLIDLIFGHFVVTITGFTLVWIIFRIHIPKIASTLIPIFLTAGAVHFIVSVFVSVIIIRLIPPKEPPQNIKHIRDQVNK